MRVERIFQWFIALLICVIIAGVCRIKVNTVPDDQREEVRVYCDSEFQDELKKVIESKKGYQVVFQDDEKDADFVLTNQIGKSAENYTKVGWSPLLVTFSSNGSRKRAYTQAGYTSKDNDIYYIDFEKVIDDAINGVWLHNIYCPKANTDEGELFRDFLLITVNGGMYPSTEEDFESCSEKVDKFLALNIVIEANVVEWYSNKGSLDGEICIFFENELKNLGNTDYTISYPNNTLINEWYSSYPTNNEELEKLLLKEKLTESGNRIENILTKHEIRNNGTSRTYRNGEGGFSSVEVPLKSESAGEGSEDGRAMLAPTVVEETTEEGQSIVDSSVDEAVDEVVSGAGLTEESASVDEDTGAESGLAKVVVSITVLLFVGVIVFLFVAFMFI